MTSADPKKETMEAIHPFIAEGAFFMYVAFSVLTFSLLVHRQSQTARRLCVCI